MIGKGRILNYNSMVDNIFQNALENKNLPVNIGLAAGRSGLLLLYINLYRIFKDERLLDTIEHNINNDLAELGSVDSLISYYRADFSIGITGFAYVLNYLFEQNMVVGGCSSSIVNDIDDIIYDDCFALVRSGKLNYMHGISGPLHHLTSKKNINLEKLNSLLNSLQRNINISRLTVYFTNDLNQVNYSAPFGITGFLLVLLKLKQTATNSTYMNECLHLGGGLIYQQLAENLETDTEDCVDENISWCEGLLMASLFLYKYGVEVNNVTYHEQALKYIRHLARRLNGNSFLVKKLNLGQGLAGLIEIFKEIKRSTADDETRQTFGILYNQFLAGIANERWKFSRENSSLFNGLAGKGLVLSSLGEDSIICKNILLL